ncbi:MAG: nucleoside hydrolase [Sphaerochaeta sp.]|uniref:nucleoside hydrolase n=1 Tax=Sphaerochaeta sp. TaxID=1972642 RepID=UPI002FC720A5
MKPQTKLILDLDTGIDDSIALVCAALQTDMHLLGVTGTYGNVTTEEGVRNTLDVLSLVGRDDVPVYAGCTHAFEEDAYLPEAVSRRIHGANGVGQVVLPRAMREAESEHAVDFLIRSMVQYGSSLTLVTTGPCTNLATAIRTEPSLRSWKGRVVMMGGALTVRGNVTHFAEANIIKDPEAAKLVLESGLDVTMVGLDVTMRSRLTMDDVRRWRSNGTAYGPYLADMLAYYIANTLGSEETYIHDPSALACALHPEYFTMLALFLTVETEGVDRGRTLVDHRKIRETDPLSKVCIDVDAPKVESWLGSLM